MAALTERDTNLKMKPQQAHSLEKKSSTTDARSKAPGLHRQLLDNRNADPSRSQQAYVSPSDAILSPASQKLAGFKQRQINKQSGSKTARTLFARAPSNSESEPGDATNTEGLGSRT